jgi:glycosyltransferase involved in cell wall biosynthesis
MSDEKPLRILHTEASLGWGGQEIRILTEAAEFSARGHAVHLACDPRSDILAAAPRFGIECSAIPMKKNLAGWRAMRGLMRRFRPDVVNAHSSIDHWLAATARIGLGPAPAITRTRHVSAPVSRNRATRWLYNSGAETVMTTSDAIVRELTADGFLPAARIASVPTGIDTGRYAPADSQAARAALGLPAEKFLFGIVATLRSWKGHAYLLSGLAMLADPRAALVIVGDGPQEENLRRRIAELGLGDRVIMAGRQADVTPWLQSLDVFVLPSYANEGVPQALLQAMACRLPIVSTPVGGIPELTAGLAGVSLVPPKDEGGLAVAMGDLLTALPPAAALDALRWRVMESYSLAIMADKAERSFRQAVALRR